jgi:Protein of unknown function (DUF3489)
MWCTRLDRDRTETCQMKTITKKAKTTKAPKATTTASAERGLGNAQGITIDDGTDVKAAKKATSNPARRATKTKAAKEPKAAGTSKKDQVLAMISRTNGATLDEIMTAMGWQEHTVRGFIAILGKKRTKIESFKSDKSARTYKAA